MFVYFVDCFCPLRFSLSVLSLSLFPIPLPSSLFPLLRTPHVSFSRWWWRWQRWSMWKLNFTSKINYAGMREAFALDGMCSSYEEIYVYLCANNKLQALANEEQWRVWELWKWIFDGYSPFRYFLFSCRLMLGIGGLNFILKLMRLFILGIFFSFSFFEMEYAPRLVIIAHHGIRTALGVKCARSQKNLAITLLTVAHSVVVVVV